MRVPTATYRIQLGDDFGFAEAAALLPYLVALGVDTLYLSPVFASAGGGGYHVTDPTRLDPSLGGEEGFARLAAACRDADLGILLDIVPNHMAATDENPWWADVLARGPESPFASFFDIDWSMHGGKVLLPVLAEPGAHVEDDTTIRVHWREGLPEINYRRFFDIGDLVCLRQEDPEVFQATHALILRLVAEGAVQGLRVDHVDGLRDPQGYLERLRDAAGGAYLLVEKILGPGEQLPAAWPVDGTTGYEVGAAITDLLTDAGGEAACDAVRARFTGDPSAFPDAVHELKSRVLRELFAGEVRRLVERLGALPDAPEVSRGDLESAVVEVTAHLPVYRTYVREGRASQDDRRWVDEALAGAESCGVHPDAVGFLRAVILHPADEPARQDCVDRWQQLSGPAMAKGFEDTALYARVALASRNEVGGEPDYPPISVEGFHLMMAGRRNRSPHALSTTSTHDSKRSEDVRARIAVLSELPADWDQGLHAWATLLPGRGDGDAAGPTPTETILLLQTLLGAWPLEGEPGPGFTRRIQEYMVKAAREAKARTSWLDPDEAHEESLREAVAGLLADERFSSATAGLRGRLALHGAVNALSQVVLKATAPGVPDLYRGTETWYLRLVDPDNRAPVEHPQAALDKLLADAPSVDDLRESWTDGRIKLWVTAAALRFRREHRALFREGSYLPLPSEGEHAESVVAFARRLGDEWAIIVVPRLTARVTAGWPLGRRWADTSIVLPGDAPDRFRNVLSGDEVAAANEPLLPLSSLLSRLPVGVLAGSR